MPKPKLTVHFAHLVHRHWFAEILANMQWTNISIFDAFFKTTVKWLQCHWHFSLWIVLYCIVL